MPTNLYVFPAFPGSVGTVNAYGDWLGRDADGVVDNANWSSDWTEAKNSLNFISNALQSGGFDGVFGIPLAVRDGTPTSGGNFTLADRGAKLAAAAGGSYDTHYTQMAQSLNNRGFGSSYVRLGWEANGNWMPWGAQGHEANFIQAYRRAADRFNAVNPNFKFSHCNTLGNKAAANNAIYPGNAYVDVIDMDIYGEWLNATYRYDPVGRWNVEYLGSTTATDFKIRWHIRFAAQNGKPLAVSEWGVRPLNDPFYGGVGHGSGDDVYFIEQMSALEALCNASGVQLLWSAYFEKAQHRLMAPTDFPNSSIRFRQLNGLNSTGITGFVNAIV